MVVPQSIHLAGFVLGHAGPLGRSKWRNALARRPKRGKVEANNFSCGNILKIDTADNCFVENGFKTMHAGHEPMSHQHMIEHIEWPLLDCIQEYHFFYKPSRDDVADYRLFFARELAQKRGRMSQLWTHDMEFRPTSFDQELLFHAPRYKQLFQVLSETEWGFSTQSTFAGALTRGGRSRSLDEEIFALIAVGRDGNDRQALSALRKANSLFAASGAPKIEYLFLVAAGFELPRREGGHASEQEMNRLEVEYADHHRITELFQFNQTVWGPPHQRADGEFEPNVQRVKQTCKALVIRAPAE